MIMIKLIKSKNKLPIFEELEKGDKVRVKQGLVGGNRYNELFFNKRMEFFCGQEVEVQEWRDSFNYETGEVTKNKVLCGEWEYNREMLEVI